MQTPGWAQYIFSNIRYWLQQKTAFLLPDYIGRLVTRDMEQTYVQELLSEERNGLAPFPKKWFFGEQGVFAYQLMFDIHPERIDEVLALISRVFPAAEKDFFVWRRAKNARGESIHYALNLQFSGVQILLFTNSVEFLEALDALRVEPNPPWIALPGINPYALFMVQGTYEFWVKSYWRPFWGRLTPEERQSYLAANQAPEDWAEFLTPSGMFDY